MDPRGRYIMLLVLRFLVFSNRARIGLRLVRCAKKGQTHNALMHFRCKRSQVNWKGEKLTCISKVAASSADMPSAAAAVEPRFVLVGVGSGAVAAGAVPGVAEGDETAALCASEARASLFAPLLTVPGRRVKEEAWPQPRCERCGEREFSQRQRTMKHRDAE